MSGNTIDPRLLSELPTDQNQMSDPSQHNSNDLADFDPADFDIDDFEAFPLEFDADTGFHDGNGEEPALPDSNFEFDPVATAQMFAKAPQEIVPIPQSVQPSPATIFPAIPPGYAYHPQVGWYMPMPAPPQFAGAAPFGMMPPQFPVPPMPMPLPIPIQAAVPQALAVDAAPKKQATKKLEPLRRKRVTDRKYGPTLYLEEQAKRRAMGDDSGPRPISRECNYGQQRADPSQTVKRSGRGGGHMKDLKAATVQRCRCQPAKNEAKRHVPRPRNAFMIFRNDFSAQWCTHKGRKRGNDNTNISIEAGKAWKALAAKDQAHYKARADAEAKEHKKLNPDYAYDPMRGIQAKFGQPSCTCGAYKVNLAEYNRHQSGGATPPNTFKIPDDVDGEDEYVAPRTRSVSRNNSIQVQTAQMVAPVYGTDMPDLDFDFDFKDETVSPEWQNLQDFDDAVDDEAEQPPTKKRRSSRNSSKSVHYADAGEEEDEQEAEETAASTTRKHRPPPISTSRKSSTASQLSAINSADFQLLANDGENVASRTRSKSNSGSEDEINLATGKSSLASLFGESDDENIVVATPKTPKSAKAKVSPATTSPAKASSLVLPPRPQTRSQSRGRKRRRS